MRKVANRVLCIPVLAANLSACTNPWADRPMDSVPKSLQYVLAGPRSLTIGNYCGFGSRTGDLSAKPVNRLDEACFRHDICYIDRKNLCGCNAALVKEARAIRDDKAQPRKMRRDATLLIATFAVPFCKMFPQGVLPPRRFDPATIYKSPGERPL